MNQYVLDTDIQQLYQDENPNVVSRVRAVAPTERAITIVTVEEQLSGWYTQLRQAKGPEKLVWAYRRLAATVRFLARIGPCRGHTGFFIETFGGSIPLPRRDPRDILMGRKGTREVVRADAGILKAVLEELSLLESALLATVAPRWDDEPLGGSPAPAPIPSLPPGLTPQYVSGARQSVLVILASRERPGWTPALEALPRRRGHRSCLRLSPGH